MANKKKPESGEKKSQPTGRRRTGRMARIKESYAKLLDLVVARNDTDFTEELHHALRFFLTSEGVWPSPQPPTDQEN